MSSASKALAVLAVGALLLSGCVTTQKSILTTCSAYARTLTALAGYRAAGKLSEADIATVDEYRPMFRAACSPDASPDGATMDALEQALFELTMIEGRVQ